MRKVLPGAAALLGAAVLQVAIAPHLTIGGAVPSFLLLVVVTLAIVEGPTPGCVGGFVGGLTLDLLGSGPIGAWAMVLTVVGYLAGLLGATMFAAGWLLPVTVVFVASLTAEVMYWVLLAILGAGAPFWATLGGVVLPAAVYNTALALLVYPWLARFLRREQPVTTFRRLA